MAESRFTEQHWPGVQGRAMTRIRSSEKGPLLRFAVSGLIGLAVVAIAALSVLRTIGQREAVRDARERAELAGHGIVEPALDDRLFTRESAVMAELDQIVAERVLRGGVFRVKLWGTDGTILYSDEPRIIGQRFPLGEDEADALATGETKAELSDVQRPENRYERFNGKVLEVYLPLRMPGGKQILFEIYERFDSVAANGRDLWGAFALPLLGALALLWLVQLPVAVRLGRRLQRSEHERSAFLEQAVNASATERSRIAAELHDGIVQELAGLSYDLAAAAAPTTEPDQHQLTNALVDGAARSRAAVRQMRAVLLDLHPSDVHVTGLRQAVADLTSPLRERGIDVNVDFDITTPPSETLETTMFRAAREALRNVAEHADAKHVNVRIAVGKSTSSLVVRDDGRGFNEDRRSERRREGHVGLSLIEGMASQLGGKATVVSSPGEGTTFAMEVPTP